MHDYGVRYLSARARQAPPALFASPARAHAQAHRFMIILPGRFADITITSLEIQVNDIAPGLYVDFFNWAFDCGRRYWRMNGHRGSTKRYM